MACERHRAVVAAFAPALVLALALTAAPTATLAGDKAATSTFSCIVNGKKLVSDRLIPECNNVEQRELNSDGSLKRVVKPTPTAEEREEAERQELDEKIRVTALNDAVRRDRNLMQRFPNEAAHQKAREKALDELRISERTSASRIAILLDEKKKLDEERRFYVNDKVQKPLPPLLKQRIDANDAQLDAQRSVSQNAENELKRINALYDAELARLKQLWAGARAGSLGPLPDARPARTPAASISAAKSPAS